MLTLGTRPSKNMRIPWRFIEDEVVLLNLEEGEVMRLNPVGAEIWNAIDGTRTVDDIVAHIQRTFDVSEKQATRDVHRFIKQLLYHELVKERPDL